MNLVLDTCRRSAVQLLFDHAKTVGTVLAQIKGTARTHSQTFLTQIPQAQILWSGSGKVSGE